MEFEGRDWHVLQVTPRAELQAAEQLKALGATTYVPMERRRVRHGRQVATAAAPLFSGYVFVAVDGRFHIARSVRRTQGFLKSGGSPARIPAGFLQRLHDAEAAHVFDKTWKPEPHALKPQDRVRFRSGPFGGQVGEIQRLDGAGRVRVLLSLFDREHLVDAKAEALEAA